jgi:DNA-binding LytR/AlgR family response regulator
MDFGPFNIIVNYKQVMHYDQEHNNSVWLHTGESEFKIIAL